MADDKTQWTLDLIEKLEKAKIGDPSRLSSIRSALENSRTVYDSDRQYLRQKYVELQEKEKSQPSQTNFKPEHERSSEDSQKSESAEDDDYALMILKNRLAKGEISPEEYDKLREKLLDKSPTDGVKSEIRHIADTMEKMQNKQIMSESIRSQLKSESITVVLAILLGFFGLSGVGHMYMGKVGKGVGVLILGLIFVVIGAATLFIGIGVIFLVIYLAIFIWQIIDSRKLCLEYNEYFRTHNEPPW